MASDSCVILIRARVTAHHLSNPQGQTHSANYFKVNSFYCLRKEFALAVFFCNPTTFLLRKFKTISTINIFLSGQKLFIASFIRTVVFTVDNLASTKQDGCGCG